jgi:hypothetical protein
MRSGGAPVKCREHSAYTLSPEVPVPCLFFGRGGVGWGGAGQEKWAKQIPQIKLCNQLAEVQQRSCLPLRMCLPPPPPPIPPPRPLEGVLLCFCLLGSSLLLPPSQVPGEREMRSQWALVGAWVVHWGVPETFSPVLSPTLRRRELNLLVLRG